MDAIIEYALLSASAYQSARSGANRIAPAFQSGWIEKIDYYSHREETGFEAKVFQRATEIVIAFTGTDEWQDWLTNVGAYLGLVTRQLEQAAGLYARVVKDNPEAQITFTGHSLGGGLAALLGVFFDRPAVTFDQAPFEAASATKRIEMRCSTRWRRRDSATVAIRPCKPSVTHSRASMRATLPRARAG